MKLPYFFKVIPYNLNEIKQEGILKAIVMIVF